MIPLLDWAMILFALAIMIASAFRVIVSRSHKEEVRPANWSFEPAQRPKWNLSRYLDVLGLSLKPLVFIAGLCLIATLISLLFLEMFEDEIGFSIAAGVTFFPLALYVLKDLVAWRAQKFETGLVDSLDLAASLGASGVTALRSLEAAAKAGSPQVKTELSNLVERLKLGDSIDGATAQMLDRYNSEGVRLFVNLLRSRWHGGADFVAMLRALTQVLRDRRTFLLQSRGQLSGAKYALCFVAVFPYLLIPFFQSQEPDWLAPITTHPAGPITLYLAILLQVIGLLWTRAILRSKTW